MTAFEIDCDDLIRYDKDLYKKLENHPTEVLQLFDMIVNQIAREQTRQDAITGVSEQM